MPKLKKMKPLVTKRITINTDASLCPDTKIGGYAFWIKSDKFTIKESGSFNQVCENSTDAEIKCIINAIVRLTSNCRNINYDYILVINTDSLGAISWIKNKNKSLGITAEFYLDELKKKTRCKDVSLRHVKGHSNKKDSRSWVNRWCDEMAGQEMKKQRKLHLQILNKNK